MITRQRAHSDDGVVVYLLSSRPDVPPPTPGQEETAWWPFDETAVEAVTGKSRAATTPTSQWAVRRDRFARSQLAADLRDYRRLLTFLGGVLVGLYLAHRMDDLVHLMFGDPL